MNNVRIHGHYSSLTASKPMLLFTGSVLHSLVKVLFVAAGDLMYVDMYDESASHVWVYASGLRL